MAGEAQAAVKTAQAYYDSDDADRFYAIGRMS